MIRSKLPIGVISLDHDLGDDKLYGTGYDVVKFCEEQAHTNPDFKCPNFLIHSQNSVGVRNMVMGIESINRKLYGE